MDIHNHKGSVSRMMTSFILTLLIISTINISVASCEGDTFVISYTTSQEPLYLRMRSGVFDPVSENRPAISSFFGNEEQYIIQFDGELKSQYLGTLLSAGLKVYEYLPDNAYLVGTGSKSVSDTNELSNLPVRWAGAYEPEFRIHPSLTSTETEKVEVTILIFQSDEIQLRVEDVSSRMDEVYHLWQSRFYIGISGLLDSRYIREISHMSGIYWMEPYGSISLMDEVSSEIVGGTWEGPGSYVNSLGYGGDGVTVAVADTGIDGGRYGDTHPDLKVTEFFDYTSSDDARDGHAHGTHCAGIIAGDASTGVTDGHGYLYGMGVAPGSTLVAQKIFEDDGTFASPSFTSLMSDARSAGAYISSNSWGGSSGGDYTIVCAEYDALVRDSIPWEDGDHPMIAVFAAGNTGPTPYSIGFPATAKNVISVGASENFRPDMGSNADDIDEMASFSSRGPTSDGRIKPDITAPGTWISSARSSASINNLWGAIDEYYLWAGGTSMAAPHVSGGAAIFVQYYKELYGHSPSPAMTKAALVIGADDMSPGSIPDNDQGWGRLNLTSVVDTGGIYHEDQEVYLSTGDSVSRSIYVGGTDEPLKVAISWVDPPASPAALVSLVNDLDLTVTAPDGRVYRGNQFIDGWSDPYSTESDRRNNIEVIMIPPSELLPGEYIVTVDAAKVAMDSVSSTDEVHQDFAMVVSYDPPSDRGKMGFNRRFYNIDSEPIITLVDTGSSPGGDENGVLVVDVKSDLTGDTIEVELVEIKPDTGIFSGSMKLSHEYDTHQFENRDHLFTSTHDEKQGYLTVRDGDTIHAIYRYPSGRELTASASIDLTPPVISHVSSGILPHSRVEILWETDEPATSRVVFGKDTPLDRVKEIPGYRTEHRVVLSGLKDGTHHYYYVESSDKAGNVAVDDAAGLYHVFSVPDTPTVLLVDDDNSLNNNGTYLRRSVEEPARRTSYSDALREAGIGYATYVVETGENGPSLESMKGYDVVMWVTGYNGRSRSDTTLTVDDMLALAEYLETGGSLWLISPLAGSNIYGSEDVELSHGDFFYDHMGVSHIYGESVKTADPSRGVFGTFMEGFQEDVTPYWRHEDSREDHAAELRPREEAYGVVLGDHIHHPYHAIAYDPDVYRSVFFAWEPSFVDSSALTDIVSRVIGWLSQPPVELSISPVEQRAYGLQGEIVEHPLTVFNSGINGADTFNIVTSDPSWDIGLYHKDGSPLTDTTKNSYVDTGRIAAGGSINIILRVNIPPHALPGEVLSTEIKMHSTLDPGVRFSSIVYTQVPILAPWVDDLGDDRGYWQVVSDNWDTTWEWGVPTAVPGGAAVGEHSWGTNLESNYNRHGESSLISPPIYLGDVNTAILSFENWFFTESGYDGGFLEISKDHGSNWKRVVPTGGYPVSSGHFGGLGGDGYSGDGRVWQREYFDISEYAGSTVRLRWRFSSSGGVTRTGWYIDDIELYVSGAGSLTCGDKRGGTAGRGEIHTYEVTITNTGDTDDTFGLDVQGQQGWDITIRDAWGVPLVDTTGDGLVDTGVVESGDICNIQVDISVPSDDDHTMEKTDIRIVSDVDDKIESHISFYTYVSADILLVDGDGGLGSVYWYTDHLDANSYTYNTWNICEQNEPMEEIMHSHRAVIWFTGNHRGMRSPSGMDPLPPSHREVIVAYLEGGGSMYLSSQGAGNTALESGYEDFMAKYFGFKVRNSLVFMDNNWWILPNPALGIPEDPISDGLDLELCRYGDFFQDVDKRGVFGEITGDGREVFRMREGMTVATSVDDVFRTVYTGFDFSSVAGAHERDLLMERLLAWLDPAPEAVTVYPMVVDEGSAGAEVEHVVRVRNLGRKPENFVLSAHSESGWHVDLYTHGSKDPVDETGTVAREGYVDIYLRAFVPEEISPGSVETITFQAISQDGKVTDDVVFNTVIPTHGIASEFEETRMIGRENGTVEMEIEVQNIGGVTDVLNIEYISGTGWEYAFYHAATGLPLEDTTGDGIVDTGELRGLTSTSIKLVLEVQAGTKGIATEQGTVIISSVQDSEQVYSRDIVVYVPVTMDWSDDLELGATGWTTDDNGLGTSWELGDPSLHDHGPGGPYHGGQCWGTNIHSNYTRTADTTLTTPLMDLRGVLNATFSYRHWYSIWGGNPGKSAADGGYLTVSTDLGRTWEYVVPEEGYNETIHQSVGVGGCYGQNSDGWLRGSINLTKYVDNFVLVRFNFWGRTPVPVTRWAGWYIDEVRLEISSRTAALESSVDRLSAYCYPDGELYYEITLINLGTHEDGFQPDVLETQGWNCEFYDQSGAPLVDAIYLAPRESRTILLKVSPPPGSQPGDHTDIFLNITPLYHMEVFNEHTLDAMIPVTLPYFNDMEYSTDGWRHHHISGDDIPDNWAITDNRSYSGEYSWWSGFEVANWRNGGDTALETPYFQLEDTVDDLWMSFWHWYSFESSRYSVMDGGIVEIWDNRTEEWNKIHPEGGYDRSINRLYGNPLAGKEAFTYTGTFPDWRRSDFRIAEEYAGLVVRFRFRVGWNLGERGIKEGWYIDCFHLGDPLPEISISDDLFQGHSRPDSTNTYTFTVENTGSIYDIFDIHTFTGEHATVELFDELWQPISSTGIIEPGGDHTVNVNVTMSPEAEEGHIETVLLQIRSTSDHLTKKEIRIIEAVPVSGPYITDLSDHSRWSHRPLEGITAEDRWQICQQYHLSGHGSWWSGAEDGGWPVGGTTALYSPYIDTAEMDQPMELSFWHMYDFGYNFEGHGDGGVVEIWDTSSGSWNKLSPEGGYPGEISRRHGNPLEGQRAFVGSSRSWIYENFDLSSYYGDIIRVRFVVGWDSVLDNRSGWYIDDIGIRTVSEISVEGSPVDIPDIHQGQRDLLVHSYELRGSLEPVEIDSITLHLSGSVTDGHVDAVKLYVNGLPGDTDPAAEGVFKRRTTQLCTLGLTVPPEETLTLHIFFDVNEYVPAGTRMGVEVKHADNFHVSVPHRVGEIRSKSSAEVEVTGDRTYPVLISVDPSPDQLDVDTTSSVVISFSKPMYPCSIKRGTIISRQDRTWYTIPFSVSWDHRMDEFTLTPSRELDENTTYTVYLNASYVKDLYDNFLDGDGDGIYRGYPVDSYSWNFTTDINIPKDTSFPGVIETKPDSNSLINTDETGVVVVFNKTMDTEVAPDLYIKHGEDPGGWEFLGWNTTYTDNDTAVWDNFHWDIGQRITLEICNFTDISGNRGSPFTWNFTTASSPFSSSWPLYRGDIGLSGQSHESTGWNPGQLEWSFSTLGPVSMQPVVGSDEAVYIGDHLGYLYSISPCGEEIWTLELCHSQLYSSPAVNHDGTIFVVSRAGYLYSVSPQGNVLWSVSLGGDPFSSPNIGRDGNIYVGTEDGTLHAISNCGEPSWAFQVEGSLGSTVALDHNGDIYIVSDIGVLYSISRGGELNWIFDPGMDVDVYHPPSIDTDGNIFMGLSFQDTSQIFKIRGDGRKIFRVSLEGTLVSSPSVTSLGSSFVALYLDSDNSTAIYSICSSGTSSWRLLLPETGSVGDIAISGDDILYIGGDMLRAVDFNGGVLWSSPSPHHTRHDHFASPTISSDGKLYVGHSTGHLYSIGYDTVPPESELDPGGVVKPYTNNRSISLPFQASDDHDLSRVELFYRRDDGPWRFSGISKGIRGSHHSGVLDFTAPDDGFYEFYILAVDAAGNTEERSELVPQVSITVDTVPPRVIGMYLKTSHDDTACAILLIEFHEPVLFESIVLEVKCSDGSSVLGTFELSSDGKVLTRRLHGLREGEGYHVRLMVSDFAGNVLDTEWSFRTDFTEESYEDDLELFLTAAIILVMVSIVSIILGFVIHDKKAPGKRKNRPSDEIDPLGDYEEEFFVRSRGG